MKAKINSYLCLRETCDHEFFYEKGKTYDLPSYHPCLQYFRLLEPVPDPKNPESK